MVNQMLFVFGEILRANIFDFLKLFVIFLIDIIIIVVNFFGSYLDKMLEIINFILLTQIHLFFQTVDITLESYSSIVVFLIVLVCIVGLVLFELVDSEGHIILQFGQVVIGAALVFADSLLQLVDVFAVCFAESFEDVQAFAMLLELVLIAADVFPGLFEGVFHALLEAHELVVEYLVLGVQVSPRFVDSLVQPLAVIRQRLTLLVELGDVGFGLADPFLGPRLVHEREENVPHVLESQLPGLIEFGVAPVNLGWAILESGTGFLRVLLVEILNELQEIGCGQVVLALLLVQRRLGFVVLFESLNLTLDVVFPHSSIVYILNPSNFFALNKLKVVF